MGGFGKSRHKQKPAKERRFTVARVEGPRDKKPRHESYGLEDLLDLFRKPEVREDKEGPGISLGKFDKVGWKADRRQPIRKTDGGKGTGWLQDDFCFSSCGYLGDIDNKAGKNMVDNPVTFEHAQTVLDGLGIPYALHTTHSHFEIEDWPRFRFIIPFKNDLTGTPEQISRQFKLVDSHFRQLFPGSDFRSAPSFFAYLPACPRRRKGKFQSHVVTTGDLFDPNAPASGNVEVTVHIDVPDKRDLPNVSLAEIPKSIRQLVKTGAAEGERSEALHRVYSELHKHGLSPAQITSVCWDRAFGISDKPREEGFDWLRTDVSRVLGKLETQRVTLDQELFKEHVYVERQKKYYSIKDQVALDHEQFTNRYAKFFGVSQQFCAHTRWQTLWQERGGKRVYDFTYWPGRGRIVKFLGRSCVNEWNPAPKPPRLPKRRVKRDQITPWLSLVETLIPKERIRRAVLDLFAFLVQQPGAKCNHHVLIVGKHGIGKDTMTEPVQYAIGGDIPTKRGLTPNRTNIETLRPDDLDQRWGYHLKSQLCVVQEIVELYNADKRKVVNKLKPQLANPPPSLRVEEKFRAPYQIPNTLNWIFFSNSTKALGLERTERRFLAVHCAARKLPRKTYRRLWRWYRKGGLQLCVKWLMQRDLSKFDPKAPGLVTEFQKTLAEAAMPAQEQSLDDLIEARARPFHQDIVSPGDAASEINLHREFRNAATAGDVAAQLTAAGWERVNGVDVALKNHNPSRVHKRVFFIAPDKATEYAALRVKSPKDFALKYLDECRKRRHVRKRRHK